MDQIDKIENEIKLVRIALLGDDTLNVKGMKQQLVEFMLDTGNHISQIKEGLVKTQARVTKIETRNKRFGWFGKGFIAGGGIVAGAVGKPFLVKILTFLSGLLLSIVSLTYIYSIV